MSTDPKKQRNAHDATDSHATRRREADRPDRKPDWEGDEPPEFRGIEDRFPLREAVPGRVVFNAAPGPDDEPRE